MTVLINILKHKAPFIKQRNNTECGAACLTMILHYYGNYIEMHKISEECGMNRDGITIKTLKNVAENNGLDCKAYKINSLNDLKHNIIFPIIMLIRENHFIVIENISNDKYFIIDPNSGRKTLRENEIKQVFLGVIITLKPKNTFMQNKKKNKWHIIIEILKKQKSNLCFITIISIIIKMCMIYIPFMVEYLIDYIIFKQIAEIIKKVSILNFIIISVYVIASYLRKQCVMKLKNTLNNDMTKRFINRFFNLPMNFFALRDTKDLTNLLDNAKYINENISKVFETLIPNILMTIVVMAIMFTKSVELSLIVIMFLAVQYIIYYLYLKKHNKNYYGNLRFKMHFFLNECLRRINLIKCTGIEKNVIASFNNVFNYEMKQSHKKNKVNSFIASITKSISLSILMIIVYFGASDVIKGNLSIGSFLGFILFTTVFIYTIVNNINTIVNNKGLKFILIQFLEVMNYEENEDAQVSNKKTIETIETIEFNNVYFSYNKPGSSILKNVTFKINKGERVAIAGSTGSGKTTLIKLILGVYKPYSGDIKINGIDINNINMEVLRRNLGIVTQESYFFNDTIRNNIDISSSLQLEDIREAAKKACIDDEFMNLPLKYNTFIGHEGRNISGGEKRRIAVARALINKPSIVIFDEGINELDPIIEKRIRKKLNGLKLTQIFVTKEISQIDDIDKFIFINEGEIIQKDNL